MTIGIIKWFDRKKGYGFLVTEDGTEAFLHYSNLDMEGYRAVEPGQTVQFEMRESDKGAQAFHVRTIQLPA